MTQTQPPLPIDYATPPRKEQRPPLLPRSVSSILGPLIGLLIVIAIFGAWRPSRFLTEGNFVNVLTNNHHFLVAAVGMTFVIVTAGIDLSVGSVMALSCTVCAMVIQGVSFPERSAGTSIAVGMAVALVLGLCIAGRMMQTGVRGRAALGVSLAAGLVSAVAVAVIWYLLGGRTWHSMPWGVGVLAGVITGTLAGFLNGALITTLGLPPFIVTLATLEIFRGLVLDISGGTPVSPDDTWSQAAKASMMSLRELQFGDFLGLPPNVWIAFAVVLVGAPLLHYTVLGRYAYAIGSNERTARLCGVNVERYKTLCYMIGGATAGLAGVMMTAKFKGGQPAEFTGAELTVIAAVVIGGTSLFGGEGTIVGSVLGMLMLGLLYSGCVIADISTFKQREFIGGTIVLAAALDRFRHLRG
jgi:ribose/xylose/arabinose/galactoside ABC-type transport system permease subunit